MNLMSDQCPRQADGQEKDEHIPSAAQFNRKGPGPATRPKVRANRKTPATWLPVDQVASEMSFAKASGRLFEDLVSLSRHILGDEDLAWDAVQESLLSLWLNGNVPENVRGWLEGAIVNRSLHLRGAVLDAVAAKAEWRKNSASRATAMIRVGRWKHKNRWKSS